MIKQAKYLYEREVKALESLTDKGARRTSNYRKDNYKALLSILKGVKKGYGSIYEENGKIYIFCMPFILESELNTWATVEDKIAFFHSIINLQHNISFYKSIDYYFFIKSVSEAHFSSARPYEE
jgi:hypothetical protein